MWLRAANLLSFWFEKFFMNISFPKQVTALGSLQFSPSSAGAECFASRPQTGEAGLEPSTFKSIYLVLSSLLPVSFLFPLAWVWGSFITNRRAVTQVKAKGMNSTVEKTMVVEGGGRGRGKKSTKTPKLIGKLKTKHRYLSFSFLRAPHTVLSTGKQQWPQPVPIGERSAQRAASQLISLALHPISAHCKRCIIFISEVHNICVNAVSGFLKKKTTLCHDNII